MKKLINMAVIVAAGFLSVSSAYAATAAAGNFILSSGEAFETENPAGCTNIGVTFPPSIEADEMEPIPLNNQIMDADMKAGMTCSTTYKSTTSSAYCVVAVSRSIMDGSITVSTVGYDCSTDGVNVVLS